MKKINWRYALGELIIVVAGITVAFALNNWSSTIKEGDLKDRYVESLQNDLAHDIEALDACLSQLEDREVFFNAFIPHLFQTLPKADSMSMFFYKSIDPVDFKHRDATLQSMKFSGDLRLLDLGLKNAIIAHYEQYGAIDRELDRHMSFAKTYLAAYFMKSIDFSRLNKPGGLEYMQDPYFRNLVFSLKGINQNEIMAYKQTLASAKTLQKELE